MDTHWLAGILLASISTGASAGANMPREGTFDFNFCFVADIHHLQISDTAGLGSFANVAAIHSNEAGGAFDLQGARCFGYYSNVEGQYTESGYCEVKDSDGDRWIMQFSGASDGSGAWKAAAGTGKYAGMVGTGKYRPLGSVTSPIEGKLARCNRNTGFYKLK